MLIVCLHFFFCLFLFVYFAARNWDFCVKQCARVLSFWSNWDEMRYIISANDAKVKINYEHFLWVLTRKALSKTGKTYFYMMKWEDALVFCFCFFPPFNMWMNLIWCYFGCISVLPAFSGNVPAALKNIFPLARITRLGNWWVLPFDSLKNILSEILFDEFPATYMILVIPFVLELDKVYRKRTIWTFSPFHFS